MDEKSQVLDGGIVEDAEDQIEHYGRKGMKWGRNIFGRKTGNRLSVRRMTTEELKAGIARLQMERQYMQLHRETTQSPGRRYVTSILKAAGKKTATKYTQQAISYAVKEGMKRAMAARAAASTP